MLITCFIAHLVLVVVKSECAFMVNDTFWPYTPQGDEKQGFIVEESLCKDDWLGKRGCCNHNSYLQTVDNYALIDFLFGSSTTGGSAGCDLCAINLKRFWCQYACDPNQSNFVKVGNWVWVPSINNPAIKVFVQQIFLTVESSTACRLFQSCKRTSFASQLSALQNAAGFLNFQGTNALDAHQIIYIDYTQDKEKSLYLQQLDNCSVKLPTPPEQYRGFEVNSNCTCNTCQSECGQSQYQPTSVLQGFNLQLVFWVWGGVMVSVVGITIIRYYRYKKKVE